MSIFRPKNHCCYPHKGDCKFEDLPPELKELLEPKEDKIKSDSLIRPHTPEQLMYLKGVGRER